MTMEMGSHGTLTGGDSEIESEIYASRKEAQTFAEKLWGNCPDAVYVHFWSAPRKRSWFVPARKVHDLIDDLIRINSGGEDVYIGVGLTGRDYGPHQRCPSKEVAGLVGL